MVPGPEAALIEQICWEIGYPSSKLASYISGEQPEILDDYPELEYYRDIVFTFKFMMTPTSDALPEIRCWLPRDARLTWVSACLPVVA